MKTEWLERNLHTLTAHYALFLDEQAYHDELRDLEIPERDWPPFISTPQADATTHHIKMPSGKQLALVCMRNASAHSPASVYGLLIHEAVHIWQEHVEHIGEFNESREFEAYAIQRIAQELIGSYLDQTAAKMYVVS